MKFPRWNSFHTKLLTTYILLISLGTSVMAGYMLLSFYSYFMRSRQTDLENWATAIGESVADAMEAERLDRVQVIVQRYGAPETVALRVFSPQGQLLASSSFQQDQAIQDWRTVPGIALALQGQAVQGRSKGVLSPDDRLYIAQPIRRNGHLLGVVRMSITLEQVQRQFTRVIMTVLGALILTILICALLSYHLARSLSKPIERMRTFAIQVGGGAFGDKLIVRQSNELDDLAIELNRMSERLASLDQERRAFLANVSHELRTPISNVHVTVEALQQGAIEEPELRDRFLNTIRHETKRLSRLIDDLLDLGRLEAGVTQLQLQLLSLKSLVIRIVNAIEPRSQAAGLSIEVNLVDVTIQGDPERLVQAILNVLDNAIKHSSQGSKIFISSSRDGKYAKLTIRDQGTGIRNQDLPHIFEQFYTTDPSRKGKGSGLGLAIAKRIIEAHYGTITVNSTVGQGATFTICLPCV